MAIHCPELTLGEAADLYEIFRGNETRKGYKRNIILIGEVWKELFQSTLFVTQSKWMQLKKGDPYNYVDIPNNCLRFLSASIEDECHNLKPLDYKQDLNVIIKPKVKACGCEVDCGCGGLCESIGGLTSTFKTVIINGQPYTETTWIKSCPNGDIMEYRSIPTLKFTFDRGAYDESYDVSYDIGDSSSEVVFYNLSRKICNLDKAPCGCPVQTEKNERCFYELCGEYINPLVRRNHCDKYYTRNNYFSGECKLSTCGTRLFIKHVENFADNQQILVSFQTTGISPDEETVVPDYSKMALFTGVDYYRNLFNDRINPRIKEAQYYKYVDEQNKLIVYKNRIAIEFCEALPQMAKW